MSAKSRDIMLWENLPIRPMSTHSIDGCVSRIEMLLRRMLVKHLDDVTVPPMVSVVACSLCHFLRLIFS